MVKTLRITSVLAAVLAVGLFAPSMAFGVDSNKEVEKFLSSPGVIEKFNKAKGRKKTAGTSQVSPLVKQAKAFALYLDPPPSPSRSKGARPGTTKTTTRRPPVVSAKFDLVGTSYYQSHPELSLALINQPGKGFQWIRQSNKVGHLVIEQIRDGLIVVRDGQKTFELIPERPKKLSLLRGQSPTKTSGSSTTTDFQESQPETAAEPASVPQSEPVDKAAFLADFLAQLEAIQAKVAKDTNQSEVNGLEGFEEIISGVEAMRLDSEEAENLDKLGKKLEGRKLSDPNNTRTKIPEKPGPSKRARPSRR